MGFLSGIKNVFTGKALDAAGHLLKEVDGLSTSQEEKALIKKSIIQTVVEAQAGVIKAEYEHGQWLSRSWRPIVMLSFAGILIYSFFIGPMFGWGTVPIPDELWSLLTIGISGFVGARTAEKLATIASPVLTGRQELKKIKLENKNK